MHTGNVFFGLVDHENPLLSVNTFSLSLVEMHLCAFISSISHYHATFIAISVQKLVAMVTPLLRCVREVSQVNSACICCVQLKVMAIFDILAYFDQNLVAMATSLRLLSEMSSLDWSTTKTPGNAPLSLVYGSVTDELPDSTNFIWKPSSAWICRIRLKL